MAKVAGLSFGSINAILKRFIECGLVEVEKDNVLSFNITGVNAEIRFNVWVYSRNICFY